MSAGGPACAGPPVRSARLPRAEAARRVLVAASHRQCSASCWRLLCCCCVCSLAGLLFLLRCRPRRFDHIYGVFRTAAGRARRLDVIVCPPEEWAFALVGERSPHTRRLTASSVGGGRGCVVEAELSTAAMFERPAALRCPPWGMNELGAWQVRKMDREQAALAGCVGTRRSAPPARF